jgi:hypothetical protein
MRIGRLIRASKAHSFALRGEIKEVGVGVVGVREGGIKAVNMTCMRYRTQRAFLDQESPSLMFQITASVSYHDNRTPTASLVGDERIVKIFCTTRTKGPLSFVSLGSSRRTIGNNRQHL